MNFIRRIELKGLFLAGVAALAVTFSGLPGQAAGKESKPPEPIRIEADRMVSMEQKDSVVFLGNVDARQGEVVIRSDEMTVFYKQEKGSQNPGGASQVEKLICKGNVEITKGDWLGTGKRMDYFADDPRRVELTGDAKAWKGQSMVSGRKITYYLDEGRSIVDEDKESKIADQSNGAQGRGRVTAIIQPGANKK